jgi:hypothetical protein
LALYEIRDISLLPERADRLLGFEFDVPAVGERRNLYIVHIAGWTVGRDSPAVAVEVLHNARVLRSVPIRGGREDVAAALGIAGDTDCVFHALVNLVGLDLEATLTFQVVLENGTRVAAGSMSTSRNPLRTGFRPTLQPLIVSTLGRSGSTWLMQLLASHPQVLVFRRFPYESAPAKYWLHMLRVLSEPGNLEQSAHPATFHEDPWWVGANPYHDDRAYEQSLLDTWLASTYVERVADFCRQSIEDWYMTLARTQSQLSPAYFAEKHVWPNYLPGLTWELYPDAREIFLVRDFRDMAHSIMAFDAKRGFAGFRRPDDSSDEDYMRGELRQMVHDLRTGWQARAGRAHLVRYEDLILQPTETFTSILEYLGLDTSPEAVREVLETGSEQVLRLPGASYEASEVQGHRTVQDPRATIGRWHRESDGSFRELSDEVFGEALAAFGYI